MAPSKRTPSTRAAGGSAKTKRSFVLVVHGGAGIIARSTMTAEMERAYRAGLEAALRAGERILARAGSSLDAVVAAVSEFEDNPLFNAGKGAAFTADGTNELDAAVMDGASLKAGAVTLVTTVRHPVQLARLVMDKTRHVLLAAHGAEALARKHGLEIVKPEYFFTDRRYAALQRMQALAEHRRGAGITEADKHGTVGAVALDLQRNLAAATSTGGRNNKLSGRVGDSPIIGAGTYANNATAAVSGTGEGEYFMRTLAAYTVSALMEYKGWSVERAAEHVVRERIGALGGGGGLIALDRGGRFAMPFSSKGMYRGHVSSGTEPVVKIYEDE
jgi:beta-aspartyl-peptidase (threonine type)